MEQRHILAKQRSGFGLNELLGGGPASGPGTPPEKVHAERGKEGGQDHGDLRLSTAKLLSEEREAIAAVA